MRISAVLCHVLFIGLSLMAAESPWMPLQFLAGEWVGEGTGSPGQGTGGFTFKLDLQDKVMVRTNFAKYPATNGRPAATHEDLMVIYTEAPDQRLRAIYFDSENHV